MDKGYDSEAIHRLIREDLHANSVIPIRSWNNEIIGGTYRQEMACQFNDIIYPRRQLVENKFSVLKRKFSGDLKARRFLIQMKEIANKMIVCNIHRFLQFLIVKVFYRAIIFILVAFWPAIFDRPTPSVSLTKINESIVPTGTIYHLSDKDFEEFPTLAAVIRDNAQRGEIWPEGIKYGIKTSWEDKEKFMSMYPTWSMNHTTGKSETYFEYKGKYYSYFPPTHP